MKHETIAEIHFIEDSEDEVFISRLLLQSQHVDVTLVHYTSYDDFLRSDVDTTSGRPLILFVDLNLPEIKGTEIIRNIRESGRFPNVVSGICTGSEDPADRLSAQKVGARFFIRKPLDVNALKDVCGLVDGLEMTTSGAGMTRLHAIMLE